MTSSGLRRTDMSVRGSPRTPMMSAYRPGASTPNSSSFPKNLAGHSVADWRTSMGGTPSSTHFTISRQVASLWNMDGIPASVPTSILTPVSRS